MSSYFHFSVPVVRIICVGSINEVEKPAKKAVMFKPEADIKNIRLFKMEQEPKKYTPVEEGGPNNWEKPVYLEYQEHLQRQANGKYSLMSAQRSYCIFVGVTKIFRFSFYGCSRSHRSRIVAMQIGSKFEASWNFD